MSRQIRPPHAPRSMQALSSLWKRRVSPGVYLPLLQGGIMRASLKPRSIYDVFAVIGCLAAVTTGTAYAANTIGSSDVIDESLLSQDIKNGEVKTSDIGADAMTSSKLANGSVQNSDLGPDAVTTSKIKAGNVGTTDIADNAILTGKIGDGNVFTNDL